MSLFEEKNLQREQKQRLTKILPNPNHHFYNILNKNFSLFLSAQDFTALDYRSTNLTVAAENSEKVLDTSFYSSFSAFALKKDH